MKKLIVGAMAGTIATLTWTGASDLARIEQRANEFASQATVRIENLKQEIESANGNNDALNREVERLQQLIGTINTEKENTKNELDRVSRELGRANRETKETADRVEQILDLNKLR